MRWLSARMSAAAGTVLGCRRGRRRGLDVSLMVEVVVVEIVGRRGWRGMTADCSGFLRSRGLGWSERRFVWHSRILHCLFVVLGLRVLLWRDSGLGSLCQATFVDSERVMFVVPHRFAADR